ncbi:MAG: hypothetical protein ACLQBD_28440 [Syntrophobacteraceae bacterium]
MQRIQADSATDPRLDQSQEEHQKVLIYRQMATFIDASEEAGHGAAFFDPHTTGAQICDFLRDLL